MISYLTTLVLLTVGLILVDHSEACSEPVGYKPPTVVQIVGWYPRIIIATVRRKISEMSFGGRRYTAEVEVECILRGDRTDVLLNVTGAGYEPGLCYGTTLEKGQRYIIGLNDDGSAHAPSLREDLFDEALEACNLNIPTYPYGTSVSGVKYVCPAGLPDGQCKEQ